MTSIVGQNGNIEPVLAPVLGQVDTEDEHIRASAKRLFQILLGLKGHLTREVKNCTSKVGQFHALMEQGATQPVPANLQIMVEYAREILENFARCQTRQIEIEKGIVDYVQMRSEVWDINDDTGLTAFIAEQDVESELCSTKVDKIRSDNLVIFAKCKSILALAQVQISRLIPSTHTHHS